MTNVLIVEDDISIAFLLEDELESRGYRVTGIARNGQEAVESFIDFQPDVAVVDVHLADGELGTDVVPRLRAIAPVGVIFSTGNADRGFVDFVGDAILCKPYRMGDIGRAIEILQQIKKFGRSDLAFPRNFRVIVADATAGDGVA